jgi:hypothetical protein
LPYRFPTKTVYTFLISPILYTCPAHINFLNLSYRNNTVWVTFISHKIPCYENPKLLLGPNIILKTLFSDNWDNSMKISKITFEAEYIGAFRDFRSYRLGSFLRPSFKFAVVLHNHSLISSTLHSHCH